jgi:hypothetical protein
MGHFGFLDRKQTSARDFNLSIDGWMMHGLDAIATQLSAISTAPSAGYGDIERFRELLHSDVSLLTDLNGPFAAITEWSTTAGREVHGLRRMVDSGGQSTGRSNLAQMERELAIVEAATSRPEQYAKTIGNLIARVGEWLRLWESTERVTGVDAARRQVQPLIAAEAEKWRGMARLELASALKMRSYEIPDETPAGLRARFQGVLRHELARLGIERNTLVMFTSDNGCRCQMGGTNHPLRGTKGTSWEGGFCVPFLAAWPGTIAPGECAELLRSVDLLPTLAGLAGAPAPADRVIDGENLRAVLVEGRSQTGDTRTMPYYWCNRLEAVRRGRWKLHVLRRELEVCELYDLASDIGEKRNVAKDHPEVVAELRRLADGFRKEFGDAAQGAPVACERPVGRVDNPRPLTEYDPEYPYAVPLYDLPDCG